MEVSIMLKNSMTKMVKMLLTQPPILDEDGEMALPAFVYVMLMSRANVVALQQFGRIGIMKNIIGMKSRRN